MILTKCKNAVLKILSDGTRRIVCKRTKGICTHQKYCAELKRFVLTPNAEKCGENIDTENTPLKIDITQDIVDTPEETPIFVQEIPDTEIIESDIIDLGCEDNQENEIADEEMDTDGVEKDANAE